MLFWHCNRTSVSCRHSRRCTISGSNRWPRKAKEEDDQLRRSLNVTVGLTLASKLRSAWLDGAERIQALEQENRQLRKRLGALERK